MTATTLPAADERITCTAVAAWLHAQRVVGHLALVLTVAAVLVLLAGRGSFMTVLLAAGVLVLSLAERYLALRLAFDRDLFAAWGRGALDGAGIDAALVRLHLAAPLATTRPLDARIAGALRLQRRHLIVVIAQAALLGGALLGALHR